MNPDLCVAIRERRLVQFLYAPGLRLVEPYVYGMDDSGRELLRGYQMSGDSFSLERGWKLFHVDKMIDLTLLEETFSGPRQGHMRNDPSIVRVYCEA